VPAAAAGQEAEYLESGRLMRCDGVHPDDRGVPHSEHDGPGGVRRDRELAAAGEEVGRQYYRVVCGWNDERRFRGDAKDAVGGDGEGP
jgi:hypothetical protein